MKRYAVSTALLAAVASAALVAGCSSDDNAGANSGGANGSSSADASSGSGSGSGAQSDSDSAGEGSAGSASSESSAAGDTQGAINDELKKNPIKFALGKAELNGSSEETLKTVGGMLAKNKNDKITVTGYVVPNTVPKSREKALSTQRAETVAEALEQDGVAKDRITAVGGGAGAGGASATVQLAG